MPDLQVDNDLIEDISARLDLREPNREALDSIARSVSQHYDVDGKQPPFEGVVDSATGVGKTYVLAAAMEYFAGAGQRNFAVITPGRTILEKTVANFTPGHRKSLTDDMSFRPVVITADNFATADMRAAMDDPMKVKLFVFTVQALVRPTSTTGRRTHKFQEGLGEAFYQHLRDLSDLVVFADEHHVYYGRAFSEAVRGLDPYALIGLTATPHKQTPRDQIIYSYPLAAAIAGQYVKAPVVVGRRDDRTDPETKLHDGLELLDMKAKVVASYRQAHPDAKPVNPVMLVIAQNIDDADEYGRILRSKDFLGGRYADAVLVVHSDAPDQALAALDKVEDPDSPFRIIISVGMLKEGWDVANVYVIASMRASVSEILTEQTLGRGLRLPFGVYTGIEFLDTLEVLAHERYEQLLQHAGVLNGKFIDYRVRMIERETAQGQKVAVREESTVERPVELLQAPEAPALGLGGTVTVGALESRTATAMEAAQKTAEFLTIADSAPPLRIPRLDIKTIESPFSLADITDLEPFRSLGRRLREDLSGELRRRRISARIEQGPDGLRRTVLITADATDRIVSQGRLLPLDSLTDELTSTVLGAPIAPGRARERAAATPIIAALLDGLGDRAQEVLSAALDRIAGRLVELVTGEARKYLSKPSIGEVVAVSDFRPTRQGREATTEDLTGPFKKSVGYLGWKRSLFSQAWFDSTPERDAAVLIDGDSDVLCWVRLHTNDLPILWNGFKQNYNPDFIVVETSGTHWIVEVKGKDRIGTDDVKQKREAAIRWVQHVNASDAVTEEWRYLLVSEEDVTAAKGSWKALKALGS